MLRFSVTLFNFLSNPRLGYYGRHFTDHVLIVIRNYGSAASPEKLLASIREQDYQHIEVVVRNAPDEQVEPQRRAGYTLTLDADILIQKGLINNMLYRMKLFGLGSLSLVPRRSLRRWRDYLYDPLSDFMLLNLVPLRLARYVRLPISPGLERSVVMTSSKGERSEVLLANKFAYSAPLADAGKQGERMYGFLSHNMLAALIYVVLLIGGPVALGLVSDLNLLALPFGLIFLSRIMVSFMTRQNPLLNLVLHPLQMLLLAGRLLRRIYVDIRRL
ncbi:hypothetical protein [Pedobacter faecalis]|uniref:hypothetical protein n=1 Tax=Pedobacter faecalis TaxID=3041495 RepID=UPI00254EA34A|nr:hypothetical protein [Pedobacter sp. ELA7]